MEANAESELGAGLTCFVISPIGSRLSPVGTPARSSYEQNIQIWERVIEPACVAFGMTPLRADRIAEPGEITDQIFTLLRDADVVIADLTGGNANVMYELGLRHTRDKITVQIGEYERLPFDVNTIRTIQFTRTEAGIIDLRESLIDTLRSALSGRGTAVSATRVWSEGAAVSEPEIASVAARSSEPEEFDGSDEPGFMDILAEGEAAIERFGQALDEMTAEVHQVGEILGTAGDRVEASDARGGGFAGRLTVAKGIANDLQEPAENLQARSKDFRTEVGTVDAAVQYLFERATADPDERRDAQGFFESLIGLGDAVDESNAGVAEFTQVVKDLPKISRVLKDPSRSLFTAMNDVLGTMAVLSGWATQARALVDEQTDLT